MTVFGLIVCEVILFQAIVGEFPANKDEVFASEKPCIPGQEYKQSCNTCICNKQKELVCSKMACSEDLKLIHSKATKKTNTMKEHVFKAAVGPVWKIFTKCIPGKFYTKKNHLCFCDYWGYVKCSEETFMGSISTAQIISPDQVYPKLSDEEFVNLPTLHHTASECKPGKVYRVECDTCLCKHDGDLLCTDLLCLPQHGINRKQAARISGQPCTLKRDLKNECVNCDCIDDVLVCNPVPGCKPALRQLHGPVKRHDTYLDLKREKCTPNETLIEKCNVCHCQSYGNLRCTQRTCLTHSETKVLRDELDKLEKEGN